MFYDGIDSKGSLAAEAPRCSMAICAGGYEVISAKGDIIEYTIPMENQGKPVIAVGPRAFKGKTGLRHITIPASVTKIGTEAFSGCKALDGVIIEGVVPEISALAFYGCASLGEIKLTAGVKTISRCAFASCSSLSTMVLPETVVTIGDEAFRDCVSLEAVVLPTSVAAIGRFAFWNCNTLTVYYMGTSAEWAKVRIAPGDEKLSSANVMYYSETEPVDASQAWHYVDGVPTPWAMTATIAPGSPAYGGILTAMGIGVQGDDGRVTATVTSTTPLKPVIPPHGVSKYDSYCDQNFNMTYTDGGYILEKFKGFSGTTVCVIPDDYHGRPIVGIGKSAFEGCKALTNLVIPGSVVVIGPSAFRDCTAISSIAIPESVRVICEFAFSGCSALVNVAFVGEGLAEVGRCAFAECKAMYDIKLPKTVTSIGSGAFFSCESLKSFTVPEGVTKIDEDTFKHCRSLASVTLGKVTEIGYEAFVGTALCSVDLPDGVKVVGSSAFASCAALKSVVIPTTLSEVGKSAFSGSEALDTVFYKGRSEEDLDEHVRFARGNDNLFASVLYCYSELRQDDGAYWRYVDGVPTPWVVVERAKPEAADAARDTADELAGIIGKFGGERDKSDTAKGGFEKSHGASERGFATKFGSGDNGKKSGGSRFGGNKGNDGESGRSRFGGSKGNDGENGRSRFGGDRDAEEGGKRGGSTPERDPYARFSNSFSFALRDGGYEIVRYQGGSAECVIPEENDGKKVTSIGQSAFFGASVTRVNVGDNITRIGDFAFARCESLAGVDAVDSVLKIGEGAFENCGSLTDISVTSTTEIGSGAFKRCTRLKSVVISHQLTKVGADAFSMCDSLARIYYIGLPKHFDEIDVADGNHAFLSAEVYFYSFDRPTTSGKAWHLVDGVPTPW